MNEERKQPYIRQEEEGEALYTRLQRQTLDEAQCLSGNVWTDFNAHDPGVTTADIVNHALAELGYKLGFPLEDYLTKVNEPFRPEAFGLFPAEAVFSATPITVDDYRKLLLSQIPELDNVRVECDESNNGTYHVHYLLSPFEESPVKNIDLIREIECTNRQLKTDLNLRPIFHKKDDRSDAHLFLGLLSYWVVNTIRYKLKQTGEK